RESGQPTDTIDGQLFQIEGNASGTTWSGLAPVKDGAPGNSHEAYRANGITAINSDFYRAAFPLGDTVWMPDGPTPWWVTMPSGTVDHPALVQPFDYFYVAFHASSGTESGSGIFHSDSMSWAGGGPVSARKLPLSSVGADSVTPTQRVAVVEVSRP